MLDCVSDLVFLQTHNQQSMPSGSQMASGMNPAGHMMEGMLDDPGGSMCSMPAAGMSVMPGMVSGQSALADLVGSGQMRMSSQWSSQQQHQLHAMPPDYGQQFQSHVVMPASGMYAGKNGAGALSHVQRMRMSFGRGGLMHSQPAYVSDDLIPAYGGPMGHPSHSQDQMQMMMQQRCVQARLPRMEMGARVSGGGMGQPMMLGMQQQQRCATVGHLPVDIQQPPQHPPSFNCSLPSSPALPAQPGLRTHALGGKMTSLPRRPPPHYSDSVMMSPGGTGVQRTPMVLQNASVRTDLNSLNSYATASDQSRVRFSAVGANSEYCGMNVYSSSIEGLQHMKNPQRDMLSRFVNNLPQ